ncbi:hypothetical protein [Mycobacteroides abscessus]|uniref:hypothetical protein n=1 Tax=Mycobacteroides abscessus TaxID=36809 RepID=UPI000C2689DC|nr:hypothetical protein [Mycobacteroides abscessus]
MTSFDMTPEQLDYLRTYFESVRTVFDDKAKLSRLSKMDAKQVLLALQSIMQTLEKAGFDQLGETAAAEA